MTSVHITVPLVPPSVNHYKMRTRRGVTFVSKEATAFKQAIYYHSLKVPRVFSKDDTFTVEIVIFRGKGQKGDADNYPKCVLDGIKEAGIIRSDDSITDLIVRKRRDPENPRTEIEVTAL